jgi:hypothetical protein
VAVRGQPGSRKSHTLTREAALPRTPLLALIRRLVNAMTNRQPMFKSADIFILIDASHIDTLVMVSLTVGQGLGNLMIQNVISKVSEERKNYLEVGRAAKSSKKVPRYSSHIMQPRAQISTFSSKRYFRTSGAL